MPEKTRVVSARERARAEITEQIKTAAREHLAVDGPNLSLRAVARDVGLVSSAVYRYFASRDELLTALIVDAYASLGDAVEQADAELGRREPLIRWRELCWTIREWALARPHEYALVYGSPVPGYHAPPDTIAQAQRPLELAMAILRDAVADGVLEAPPDKLGRVVRAEIQRITTLPGFEDVPVTVLARAMSVWAQLFGTISFELFGRYTNAITDFEAYFEVQIRVMARYLGLET